MDTLSRTGVTVPTTSGSDATTAFRLSTRSIGAFLEASGAIYASGPTAGRPTAGKFGRFYLATDDTDPHRIYLDNGTTWLSIGLTPATDPAAGVGGLRTLGAGSVQAAPGNHTHGDDTLLYATAGVL